ncbi:MULTISPECIES: Stp1/IreP family PP2C-type Ser/Thr phosphatase [Enterococcus]|uniref:Stp1/IreP family PP2C-type Ser/Thr phosphatase n=1 Tax=Enterococcus TaxID=1350 RepID=UPI0010F67590|nr:MULTISPECIES: Stp1/IreP family PP2C-type Ser/Thr phosphatase [Enterococcus]KAF1300874.1 protein phosphatase [Enterococcus sp. JM9B]
MEIRFRSDVGKKRNTNQDYAAVFKNKAGYTLALLADGMGGHLAGDVASKQAVHELGDAWAQGSIKDSDTAEEWLVEKIQAENTAIFEKGQENPQMNGMGTTVVAVILFDDQFTLGHVGDSRVYLFREGELIQLTEDHSLVNELVKSGEITKEMAANHPRRNVLTRSVGMPGEVEVDVDTHFLAVDDYLLLASDGLTNMVSEAEITEVLASDLVLDEKIQVLIDKANAAGGVDNITVLLIEIGGERP